jgi:hypothetical protein
MQELGLTNELDEELTPESNAGFWKRQFQQQSTKAQRKFDWLFGVIMPIVCFVFDPIVFTNVTYLGNYKAFGYTLSFISIMAMSAWLIWGAKLKWLNAILAGLFIVGSVVAFGIGIIIFPISLIGLIFLIGALGFTPLFTTIVFLRNSVRAFRAAKPFLEKKVLVYSFSLAALFSAVIPSVVNVEINNFNNQKSKDVTSKSILLSID